MARSLPETEEARTPSVGIPCTVGPSGVPELGAGRGILEDVGSPPWRARRPVPTILQKFQLELKHLENLGVALVHGHTPQRLGLHEFTSPAMTVVTPTCDVNHIAASFLVIPTMGGWPDRPAWSVSRSRALPGRDALLQRLTCHVEDRVGVFGVFL